MGDRIRRLLATMLGFALFAAGCLCLSFIFLPFATWRAGSATERQNRSRQLFSRGSRFFIRALEKLGAIKVEWEVLLPRGNFLVLANHPTLLDVLLLLSFFPDIELIAKASLWQNVFLRRILEAGGYLSNLPDEEPTELIVRCGERLRQGGNILLFPEGTRSVEGRVGKFSRGAAAIAIESNCLLLPVIISCRPLILSKERPWYMVPEEKPVLQLRICEPIAISNIISGCPNRFIAARRLTEHLEEFFKSSSGQ